MKARTPTPPTATAYEQRRTNGARVRAAALVVAALALAGCATMRGVQALRQVEFEVDRVAAVRLAGVGLDRVRSPRDVNVLDAARIAGAAAARNIVLEFDLHILGRNPVANRTTARLVRLQWTLDLNGRETVSGTLDTAYTFVPGEVTDVRVPVRLELWRIFQGSGADAIDLALGLAGIGARPVVVALRAAPVLDTPLGTITYPGSFTIVRRTVGGP